MSLFKLSRIICSHKPRVHRIRPQSQLRCFSHTAPQLARARWGRYPPPGSVAEEFDEDDDPEFDGDEEEEVDLANTKVPNLSKLGIRMLEQDPDGKARRLQGPSELERQMVEQNKQEMEDIDKDFAQLESEELAADAEVQNLFTQEQRDKLREQILEASRSGYFKRPYQIDVDPSLSRSAVTALERFNEAMETARIKIGDNQARLKLWRCYERAKIYVPGFVKLLTEEVWAGLWQFQSQPTLTDSNKSSHLKVLCEDLVEAGHHLSQEQKLARIEGHFADENHKKALELWESGLNAGDSANANYVELGIRMYAEVGNLKRAEELLEVLYKLYAHWNPRVIIMVIFACIRLGTAEGNAEAFGLYLRLRDRLTSDMSMEDYDEISTAFLHAGQKEYAQAVFRDMILSGDTFDTPERYSAITRAMGSFISLGKDAQEVNRFGLESLSVLPRRFQNKFFYASWMRKLIAMGKVDEAANVAELMLQRGVRPDARHMNGLIAAWFRSGNRPSMARAEKLAWSMIQSRLDFVRLRKRRDLANGAMALTEFDVPEKSIYDHAEEAQVPVLTKGYATPATVETFSILVQFYLRRSRFGNVRHLRNLLIPAEIAMNSFFMNHLLYAEVRNRTHRDVWNRFEVLSRTAPSDVETFACLWQCMKTHVDPSRNLDPRGYPTPRQLFARMGDWFSNLTGQQLRDARGDMEPETYDNIIHCFCLARDLEGSFVALQALKDMWGITPQPSTIRLLLFQIARLNAPLPLQRGKPSRRKSRHITASKANQENLAQITQILDMITRIRHEQLLSNGVKFEELDVNQQGEENHRTILQLLLTTLKEVHGEPFNGQQVINEAARDIGLEEFDVERAIALTV